MRFPFDYLTWQGLLFLFFVFSIVFNVYLYVMKNSRAMQFACVPWIFSLLYYWVMQKNAGFFFTDAVRQAPDLFDHTYTYSIVGSFVLLYAGVILISDYEMFLKKKSLIELLVTEAPKNTWTKLLYGVGITVWFIFNVWGYGLMMYLIK